MTINKEDSKKSGIYCIINKINNKIYIGKSKDIYKRLHQHLYDFKNRRLKCCNKYLLNSFEKYGKENFTYRILEILKLDEELLKERELYWMDYYRSCERDYGYNLRRDSSTNMITHPETSKKISDRLKKEWKEGIRKDHSKKLSDNWKNNSERILLQSELFSQIKTKYQYEITYSDGNKETCKFQKLKELDLQNVQAIFHRKNKDEVMFKGFLIKRLKI